MPKVQDIIKAPISGDIENILNKAYLSSVRSTFEYQMGNIEAREDIFKERCQAYQEKIERYSEMFRKVIKHLFPKIKIVQHRIGIDYSTGTPAVLMIVSENDRNYIPPIRTIARSLEHFMWENDKCDGYVWTRTDKNLEQAIVDRDFPLFRKEP